jgi:aromatic ring-opening dioxygenase catalytic subunit (LigB family)
MKPRRGESVVAKITAVVACSHSPYLYDTPDTWDESRRRRRLRDDVPWDSVAENASKHARCVQAFRTLRERVAAAKPDVLLVFGDDQYEQFNFRNFPAFAVCLAESFEGTDPAVFSGGLMRQGWPEESVDHRVRARGCPELGKHLAVGLMRQGFDLAFCLNLPDPERGIGHAFTHPSYYIDPDYRIPILPFFVNCYYPPQPTGRRCYQLGRAVREVIEQCPLDLNVAVVGSGGLWHTPLWPEAYLDEGFDQAILAAVRAGDAGRMAEFFDQVPWKHPLEAPPELPSHLAEMVLGVTGMAGGVGSGSGETRNWIAAAAVADGSRGTVVDYVPVYASPCGMGFAYWDLLA